MAAGYWNHNTAHHPWILRGARTGRRAEVLDVGCGDGLLMQRLAPVVGRVTGVEPDAPTAARAAARLKHTPRTRVLQESFAAHQPPPHGYDLITFVASLHHMELAATLTRARDMLAPGGELLVVGLARNATPADWILSGLQLPLIRIGSRLHRETADIGVPVAEAAESLAEIRTTAGRILPGVRIRRAGYYRYRLRWARR